MNQYYLYFHINPLLNTVFYVGIGKTYYKNNKPKRPYSKRNRNKFWHNIVNKYNYIVDIIETNLTKDEAIIKEQFYIKWFGRRDLGLGTLVNMTDGGDGNYNPTIETRLKIADTQRKRKGYKMSKNAIENMIKAKTGTKHTDKTKEKISKSHKGIIFTDTHKMNISKAKQGISSFEGKQHNIQTKEKIQEKLSGISTETRKMIETDLITSSLSINEISIKYNINKYKIYNIRNYLRNNKLKASDKIL